MLAGPAKAGHYVQASRVCFIYRPRSHPPAGPSRAPGSVAFVFKKLNVRLDTAVERKTHLERPRKHRRILDRRFV